MSIATVGTRLTVVLYLAAMVATIVGLDVAFFRDRLWERLTLNVGVVMVFTALYFRFLRP